MPKEYVLLCCLHGNGEVLVVHKDRPAWQAGRINLPGGKIEPDDCGDPIAAAMRELYEESGYYTKRMHCSVVGRIIDRADGNILVHVVLVSELYGPQGVRAESETELVEWMSWSTLQKDPRLIPNLRAVIPLAKSGVTDWCISDPESSFGNSEHSFQVTVSTYDNPAFKVSD